MKLRKNQMISPKNFFALHWGRKNSTEEIRISSAESCLMGILGLLVVLVPLAPLALLENTTAPRESLLISNF